MPSPSELPELIWESRKSQVLASSDVHATLLERVRKIIIAVHEQMLSMRPWISTSLRRGRQCVSLTSFRSTIIGGVQAVTGAVTDSSNSHIAYLMRSQEQNTQNQNRVRLEAVSVSTDWGRPGPCVPDKGLSWLTDNLDKASDKARTLDGPNNNLNCRKTRPE